MRLAVLSEIPLEWEGGPAALDAPERPAAPRPRRPGAGPRRRGHAVRDADRRLAARPLARMTAKGLDALSRPRRRLAAESPAGGQAPFRLGGADEAYEQACQDFLAAVLDPDRPAKVAQDICAFVQRIAPAGALNSLSQLAAARDRHRRARSLPGLRAVGFLHGRSRQPPPGRFRRPRPRPGGGNPPGAAAGALLADWRDGRIKLAILARAMASRAANPALFLDGSYTPLKVEGALSGHALAALRSVGDHACPHGNFKMRDEFALPRTHHLFFRLHGSEPAWWYRVIWSDCR